MRKFIRQNKHFIAAILFTHQCEVSVHHTAQKHKAVQLPHLYVFLANPASENVLPLLLASLTFPPAHGMSKDYLFPRILD